MELTVLKPVQNQ